MAPEQMHELLVELRTDMKWMVEMTKDHGEKLNSIEVQAKITNGRVTGLEEKMKAQEGKVEDHDQALSAVKGAGALGGWLTKALIGIVGALSGWMASRN